MIATYSNWPTALANRLVPRSDDAVDVIRLREPLSGRRVELLARRNSFDLRTINEVWIGSVYDRWVIGDTPLDAIIDLGANCGYFSILAALRLKPTRVVSVEPDPRNLRILRANVALNGLEDRIQIVESAIIPDDTIDRATLRTYEDPRLNSLTTRADNARIAGDVEVAAQTVCSLLQSVDFNRISLLKLDIEGLEWPVLQSLANSDALLSSLDNAVIEADEPLPETLRRQLTSAGLQFVQDGPFYAFRRVQDL